MPKINDWSIEDATEDEATTAMTGQSCQDSDDAGPGDDDYLEGE